MIGIIITVIVAIVFVPLFIHEGHLEHVTQALEAAAVLHGGLQ